MARRAFSLRPGRRPRLVLRRAMLVAGLIALALMACAGQPPAGSSAGAAPAALPSTTAVSPALAGSSALVTPTPPAGVSLALPLSSADQEVRALAQPPAPTQPLAREPIQADGLTRIPPRGVRQDAVERRPALAAPAVQPKAPPVQQVAVRPVSAAQAAPPPAPQPTPTPTAGPSLPTPSRVQDNMRVYLDIPYDSAPGIDPRQLSLDVYAPEGARGRDVVVFVHGGGWSGGDKSDIHTKDHVLTAAGYVFVSINYRLLPAGAHPTNVRDVARALAWIHKNAERYGGNPGRIFLLGHSAGAHLSGLVATDERYLAAEREKLTMLKGVVLLDSNAYNIPLLIPHLANDGNVYVTAFGYKESPLWRDASPVTYVAPGKGIPPFLVVHANRDVSRAEQAESMAHALRAAGIRADLLDIPDRDHASLCDRIGTDGDRATSAILDFFRSIK